jgi:hypothetical protein
MSADRMATLTRLYDRFNARDIAAILPDLHPDVDWPNGWEGGRVLGRAAVRDYWTRQWSVIDSSVEPLGTRTLDDGRVDVTVHQMVRSLEGAVLADEQVSHLYTFEGDVIRRMDIVKGTDSTAG